MCTAADARDAWSSRAIRSAGIGAFLHPCKSQPRKMEKSHGESSLHPGSLRHLQIGGANSLAACRRAIISNRNTTSAGKSTNVLEAADAVRALRRIVSASIVRTFLANDYLEAHSDDEDA